MELNSIGPQGRKGRCVAGATAYATREPIGRLGNETSSNEWPA